MKVLAAIALIVLSPTLAAAQRFSFEQSFDLRNAVVIDVTTIRGKIEVVAGPYDRVVVSDHLTLAHDAKIKVRKTVAIDDPWVNAQDSE